jgi:3-oxoacyl-[acyl-carrier protein] reductase
MEMKTTMKLAGKVAIVTGAGSGFGEGIARRFAAEGARVVVNDLKAAATESAVQAIQAAGGEAVGVSGDISSAEVVSQIVNETVSRYRNIDILVNNAGYTHSNQSLLTVTEEDFDRVFKVNVKSIYHFIRDVIPQMRRHGGGSIINVGSIGAIRPRAGLGWYCASKGAVITLTKTMAVEFATDQIRVNCICPSAGDTGMMRPSLGGIDTPERRARILGTIPLGRFVTPGDVAAMASFLAADEASYITGGIFPVDGGRGV